MWLAVTGTGAATRDSFCTQTALALFDACEAGIQDDAGVAKAVCLNIANPADRTACNADATDARDEADQFCRDQHAWRLQSCLLTGEGRYDPDFSPARFDDPSKPGKPNLFFPLAIGDRWEYRGGNEVNTLEVTAETKLIAGVRCAVVRDLVFRDGPLAEATDDWFVPAKDGSTWYFGEETKEYETFAGDDPVRPELVGDEGSFKAGRDGAKPGIIFLASPRVGDVYFEEFSPGNAEDATEILSTTYAFGGGARLDQGVPRALAERFCSGNCVVTRNFSLLEPGIDSRKYYAPGIGVFLEIESTGELSQLVDCSFDARCRNLPAP